jgi:hypothetical protein
MLFLYAGIIYLIAIAVVLVVKPAFMFRSDGTWKEFGIGRNRVNYTPMPLWLYSIVSALVSYFIVLLVAGSGSSTRASTRAGATKSSPKMDSIVNMKASDMTGPDLEPGYYVLNKAASKLAGVPKYVYIGAEAP